MSVAVVQSVKTDLEARGFDLSGPCGAFAIASRVAWQLRDTGLGLNHQDANRTHCASHGGTWSPDFLIYPDGNGVDTLIDGGGANTPSWQPKQGDAARWRAPFNPDEGTTPGPDPEPPQPPDVVCRFQPTDQSAVLAELSALRAEVAVLTGMVQTLLDRPAPVPDVRFPQYTWRSPAFGGTVTSTPVP